MHEASIAFEIYTIVTDNVKAYNLKKVDAIYIKVGSFNGIFEDSLRFAFKAISKASECEEAALIIEHTEGFELLVNRIEGQ
jgi:hydrogenase nickel incorporation protein HypA/HybF